MVCPLPQNYSSPIEYQYYLVSTREYLYPPPPPHPPPKKNTIKNIKKIKKKNKPKNRTQGKKKKKKEGAIFANPPSEDSLVDELHRKKARKAWPTATILNEMFEFSGIYVCQKYYISGESVCNLHNEYSVQLYLLY